MRGGAEAVTWAEAEAGKSGLWFQPSLTRL